MDEGSFTVTHHLPSGYAVAHHVFPSCPRATPLLDSGLENVFHFCLFKEAVDLEAAYLVLVTCRDEQQQVELLRRFQQEGLPCKALLS